MESVLSAGDGVHQIRKPALSIKGAAAGYGYPQIGEAARVLHEAAGGGSSVEDLREALEALRRLHRAACASPEVALQAD